jgi:hypothetical protein
LLAQMHGANSGGSIKLAAAGHEPSFAYTSRLLESGRSRRPESSELCAE